MAGLGRKAWAGGELVTVGDFQGYLQDQAVMVFASAAARSAAIPAPSEGMASYLQDTNSLEVYTGTVWVPALLTNGGTVTGTLSCTGPEIAPPGAATVISTKGIAYGALSGMPPGATPNNIGFTWAGSLYYVVDGVATGPVVAALVTHSDLEEIRDAVAALSARVAALEA